MKRLKTLFMVVCCLLSVMALSSDAFALVLDGSSVTYDCPYCGSANVSSVVSSFRQATEEFLGLISTVCPKCHKAYTRSTKFWGEDWRSHLPDLNIGDVVISRCWVCVLDEVMVVESCTRSCAASGSGRLLLSCSRNYSSFTLPKLSHSYVETSRTSATCTTPGSIASTCSRCQDTHTETVPALGHDYITTCTDPTCTTPGSIVSTCSRCQDAQTEPIPALDHDWQEAARADPTCTTPGSITSTCSRCQDTQTETLPALYHSWESGEMVPSTYDEDGNLVTEGYTFYNCSSCGSSFTAVAGSSPPDSGAVSGGIGGEGMSDTTAALGKTFLSGIWALFAIGVPGFGFTFGQMWLGVLLASVSILVVRMIFGFGGGPRGETSRTSSTNNPRISKERQRDEF